ncbi:highly divergent homeobox [Chanos chanos]|uniref:Highly divergent homeobox n=1 Tax=Chanos chanos TaxID=29144 RepID=A0A6J2USP8_CHACN|nr:highly divergent homeobox [Chanos chanos]
METWQEKRSMQTMNLRSVFTAEQQRILERYYENGMTNQSKSCFQLILQCAQETKLDFSVVRTWVGNKRRKLASKANQNGSAGQGYSSHVLAGAAGALVAGPVLPADMAAVRGLHRGPTVSHLHPPTSCPSSSSSPSSSSPVSSENGNNSNNDVIVTGIYSPARNAGRLEPATHGRTGMKALALHGETELPIHARVALNTETSTLHSNATSTQRKTPQLNTSSSAIHGQVRKTFSQREAVGLPLSWAKQYGMSQHQSWSSLPTSPQSQRSPPPGATEPGVRIQQVFTLAGLGDGPQRPLAGTSQEKILRKICTPDLSESFSIAMETCDADDEYSREEELANMGAQIQTTKTSSSSSNSVDGCGSLGSGVPVWFNSRGSTSAAGRGQTSTAVSLSNSDLFGEKGCQTNHSFLVSTSSHGSTPFRFFTQTSPTRMTNLKVTDANSPPWLTSNSRKRTLQDRTQFSDRDLLTLKRYWDNGMTSLGSVCREKIAAAATELSVDSEIIKTWIGNRRRKYRLMGIELPPPKGGPPSFPRPASAESPLPSSPEEPKTAEQGVDGEQNDVSICLSEDGASDTCQKDMEDQTDPANNETNSSTPADNVKIEIIDEDDEDMMATDMENMHNLLEFKHEEVQYLESELENQKQRYYELKSFTKSLLMAVKNNDQEKQQELLASLPQDDEEDWELSPQRDVEPSVEMTSNQTDSSVSEAIRDT